MGTSECLKNVEISSLDACPVNGDTEIRSLVVVEQAWMDPQYTLLSSELFADQPSMVPSTEPSMEPSTKAEPQIMGGSSGVPLDDEAMLAALQAGMKIMNQQSNSGKLQLVVRVLEVTRQVVAGLKYVIRIEMGQSECRISDDERTLEECPVDSTAIHELTIWDQPWEDLRYQLLEHSPVAEPELSDEPELMDADKTMELTDNKVLEALQAGMALMNAESGYDVLYQAVRVVEASQIVADGLVYTMLVELGATECSNTGVARSINDCPVVGETRYLKVQVWDKPWEEKGKRFSLGNHPLKKDSVEETTTTIELDIVDKNSDKNSEDEIWQNEMIVYAVGTAMAAAALVLVPATAYWYFKMHTPHNGATLVSTEEASAHDQL
jgi:hypothetical protein